jgi:alanyl-tRNA synthetase
MDLETAKSSGAVALFGEKYAEDVRVLSMGAFSKELCGGTHARRTGDIGLFKIVAEYGIASGVRRIELVTGDYALAWVNEQLDLLEETASLFKTNPAQLKEKVSQFLLDNKKLEKEISKFQAEKVQKSGTDLLSEVEVINGMNVLVKRLDGADAQILRTTMDQLKSSMESAVLVLYAIDQNKMSVVAGVSKNILGKAPAAGLLVRELCGKGGGRDDMAQGGGDVPSDLEERLSGIKELIKKNCY